MSKMENMIKAMGNNLINEVKNSDGKCVFLCMHEVERPEALKRFIEEKELDK